MNQHLIILFLIVPMAMGIVTTLLHRLRQVQRVIGVVSLSLNVAMGVWTMATVFGGDTPTILVSQMGNWPAPFGITIAVDPLSAIMLATASLVCLAVFIYCISQLPDRFSGGYFHPLFHFLVFGVQWSFITGDLFNLFVAFEIMLMASYAMFVVGTTREQMRQAYKYVLLNLIGSTMFVTMAGLLYGQLGTLNMADITRIAMSGQLPQSSLPVIAMFLLVFGGKAAIFPLWYWLPDTYHTMPAPLGGLFAGLLTKVGAYVMIRVFVMMFGPAAAVSDMLLPIVLISAVVTMFVGVLGAVSMHTVRSILSIHIISQVGYMVMGIGLGMSLGLAMGDRELGVAGAIFFIIHNMVVKCSLFLCGGLMRDHAGSDDLDRIGGLLRRAPWLATLFMIAAMSLAGLPPTSGFFGKFALIQAGWSAGGQLGSAYYWVTGFALATSLLTLLSMLKIWSYGFWSPARGDHVYEQQRLHTGGGILAIAMLVVLAAGMGLGAQWCMTLSRTAASLVLDPRAYIAAVLGPQHVPADTAVALTPDPSPLTLRPAP